LPHVEFTYNRSIHSITSYSLSKVVYGFNSLTPLDILHFPSNEYANFDGKCHNLPFGGRETRGSRVCLLSQPTLLRASEARLTGAYSIGGKCVESPPTFIERKMLEKPKETGHEEYSRFGSYLYV